MRNPGRGGRYFQGTTAVLSLGANKVREALGR